ncbi:MAG TPA: DUF488 domain-containing protein [Acidimicrobiales bacterium]|nr:DUF488 domain-containing protein [Acidimicrobiales bacterium]
MVGAAAPAELLTVGHGTLEAEAFSALLVATGVEEIIDVRSFPGSRRHPHFGRDEMERWLPRAGVAYRWEKGLGGFRRARPDSANTALRHPSFRGYADYMSEPAFAEALDRVVGRAAVARVAVMCSEAL